jgi:Transcriptional regulator
MVNAEASRTKEELDPRVRRTRKLLQDGLARLLKNKEFDKISIGDIAEESTLNRATFYDHYPHKLALLECLVAGQFQELIEKQGIVFSGCEGALKSIAMGVCYYLAENAPPGADGQRQANSPMETAIVAVVRRGMLDGLSQHPPKSGVPAEVLASTVAWAIYGAAKEWVQSEGRVPVSEIGETIERIVKPMLMA